MTIKKKYKYTGTWNAELEEPRHNGSKWRFTILHDQKTT